MAKKSPLFELIQSLSRSEKRYFKLMAQREGSGSNYVRLFEAIAAQSSYDEAAIKQQFAGEKMVAQLHVTKNYLRKLILKSLRNFHSQLSKNAAVKDVLRNIEILFNKELYDQCYTELKRAETMAQTHELHAALIEVYDWKRKLQQNADPHNYDAFDATLADRENAIGRVKNANDYVQLIVGVSRQLYQTESTPLRHEHLLSDPANAQSVEALVMHYNANYFRAVVSEPGKGEALMYELVDALEQRPEYIRENPSLYVATINNFISYFVFQKQPEEALQLIARARETYEQFRLKSENRTLLKQVLRTYNVELEVYRSHGLWRENPAHVDVLEAFVEANTNKMPTDYLVSFWFQLANIRFMQGNLKLSLKWVNNILQLRASHSALYRTDIQLHARMLNLMIHTDQQNLFVLRYFVDSARRYVRKIKQPDEWERILLSFFSRLGKSPLLEYKDRFRELHTQLFPENGDSLISASAMDYVNYKEWIEGRM